MEYLLYRKNLYISGSKLKKKIFEPKLYKINQKYHHININ